MKYALWIWTALCAGIVILTFFAAPAWDTTAEGWDLFSGREVFTFVAFVVPVPWIVGIGLLFEIDAVIGAARRRLG